MENFLKVLTAALAIFAALALWSSIGPFAPSGEVTTINETIFSASNIGGIGYMQATPREIEIGKVTVGNLVAEETPFYEQNTTIKNGIFAKSGKSITFSAENVKNATLSFFVKDTNSYGNLNVNFNGNNIFGRMAAPGKYTFPLSGLKESNSIEIFADSSGAKFWAPATYLLTDLTVSVDRYADRDRVIPFQIYTYEASGWSFGRVAFVTESVDGPANLTIGVNGKPVYIDTPPIGIPFQTDFNKLETRIAPGENVLSFSTGKDTVYNLKNTKLIIFYYGTGEAVYKIQQFDVNDYWRAQLRRENITGIIRFYVKSAPLDSGLDVSVNNKTYSLPTVSANTWYNVTFKDRDLSNVTRNTLKFSTHGSYEIGAVDIGIASGIDGAQQIVAPQDTGKSKDDRLWGVLVGMAALGIIALLVYFFRDAKWLWIAIAVVVMAYLFFRYIVLA